MKIVSTNLLTHLGGTVLSIAKCIKITRQRHQLEIVDITKADPGALTTKWAHGFNTGDVVRIVRVRGMTEVNDTEYVVTITGPTSFTIGTDTSAFSAYTERGEARRVLGFTTYNKSFIFEKVVYNQAKAYSPSAVRQAADLSVSNLNLIGIIDSDAITDHDVRRGLFDNARIEFFLLNYNALGDGKMFFGPGRESIGEVTTGRHMYEAEFRGLEHLLQQTIGNLYSPTCRADLGDDEHPTIRCNVRLEPPKKLGDIWGTLQIG